jgi:Protein of unknown function (DUF1203)
MTTATHTRFTVQAIPASTLDRIRTQGADDWGNPFQPMVDVAGGSPLRCCLRDAAPGERIALIAYQPADRGGPYAEVGPVFVHAERCDGYQASTAYPEGFRDRRQLFRAYDLNGAIVDAIIVRGEHAEDAIDQFFARPEVDYVHSRNVRYGCYMFAIRRRS